VEEASRSNQVTFSGEFSIRKVKHYLISTCTIEWWSHSTIFAIDALVLVLIVLSPFGFSCIVKDNGCYLMILNLSNEYISLQISRYAIVHERIALIWYARTHVFKVSVVFNKIIQKVDQNYICLEVNELSTNVSVMEYVMEVSAMLGSIHLTDYCFKGKFHVVVRLYNRLFSVFIINEIMIWIYYC
jgi:hypothetical protein